MNKFPAKSVDLIVFDLDGTLTESRTPIDAEMAELFVELLRRKKVAVIGGGSVQTLKEQLLNHMDIPKPLLARLFLFPQNGAEFWRYRGGWKRVYADTFTAKEKKEVERAFAKGLEEAGYQRPKKVYGKLVSHRGGQSTFAALGADAPLALKKRWNKTKDIRPKIVRAVKKYLYGFEVHIAGTTSIDVTREGIDKAYGIRQMEKYLRVPQKKILFVGDALFKGGNDEPVKHTRAKVKAVRGPAGTRRIVRGILTNS